MFTYAVLQFLVVGCGVFPFKEFLGCCISLWPQLSFGCMAQVPGIRFSHNPGLNKLMLFARFHPWGSRGRVEQPLPQGPTHTTPRKIPRDLRAFLPSKFWFPAVSPRREEPVHFLGSRTQGATAGRTRADPSAPACRAHVAREPPLRAIARRPPPVGAAACDGGVPWTCPGRGGAAAPAGARLGERKSG